MSWIDVGWVARRGCSAAWVSASRYIDFFSDVNKIYGALAGVIVLLLWLYLTCYLIVLGGEINAEAERQTACDTTVGMPMPMGHRGGVIVDTMQ